MRKTKFDLVLIALTTILVVVIGILMGVPRMMSPVWAVPYLSGAMNSGWDGEWRFAPDEVDRFKALNKKERLAYKFKRYPREETTPYGYNRKGFVYVVKVADLLFGAMGTINATKCFHLAVHLILCIAIVLSLRDKVSKLAFTVLYTLNPVVLVYVVFPFYYFWQSVPSAIAVLLVLHPQSKKWVFAPAAFVVSLVFLIRPTILFLFVATACYWCIKRSWSWGLAGVAIFVATIAIVSATSTGPRPGPAHWHTIFVGLGAYPDGILPDLSDDEGYKRYERVTGEKINASIDGNFYSDALRKKYYATLKDEYKTEALSNPIVVLKNATLNVLQSFSFGYLNDGPVIVAYLSALIGLVFLSILIWKKKYICVVLIFTAGATFTPYYPPIPGYMFGSYVLLVVAAVLLLEDIRELKANSSED